MNKTVKISIMIILIVIVALAIICLVYNHFKQEPVDANIVDTNIEDGNTGLDNIINELFEEEEENTVANKENKENRVSNTQTEKPKKDNNKPKNETKNTETTTEPVTSREEKAIELVKNTWGDTTGLIVSCVSIDNEGRYVVSVNDAKTSRNLGFFTVDVDSKTVEKQ